MSSLVYCLPFGRLAEQDMYQRIMEKQEERDTYQPTVEDMEAELERVTDENHYLRVRIEELLSR